MTRQRLAMRKLGTNTPSQMLQRTTIPSAILVVVDVVCVGADLILTTIGLIVVVVLIVLLVVAVVVCVVVVDELEKPVDLASTSEQ